MKSFIFIVINIYIYFCDAKELPSFLHVCHKDDPNLEECFIAAVEDLRPYLVKGVPEHNIPSLEPLVIDDLISEETAGMKITATGVKAYGCSDFFVRNIDFNIDNQVYDIDIDLPQLRIEAHYSVDGKLLLLPIKGNGDMEANVTNIKSKTHLQGEVLDKDGDKYLKYTSCVIKTEVGDGRVRLGNLFGGDKILNDIINDTINKNLNLFLKELMPVVEKALANSFLQIGNNIVEPFTYKQLFPH